MSASFITQLRDAAFTRLTDETRGLQPSIPNTRKVPFPTVQPDQVPALGVYVLRENYVPDGDADVSVPRFQTDSTLGFSVMVPMLDPTLVDSQADDYLDQVLDILLTDPSFLGLKDAATNKPFVESITAIARSYVFPTDGEAYYIEGRLQITFHFRCFFEPVTANTLEEVDVTREPPVGVQGSVVPTAKITLTT